MLEREQTISDIMNFVDEKEKLTLSFYAYLINLLNRSVILLCLFCTSGNIFEEEAGHVLR